MTFPTAPGREPLLEAITTFLAHHRVPAPSATRASLAHTIDRAGDLEVAGLCSSLGNAGADWSYYPADPLARRIHLMLADRMLDEPPLLVGREHLEGLRGREVVLCANHLSYTDANLLDVLFARTGFDWMASRLTVVAGPKVYTDVRRRFSSLCFGTIRTPQNSAVSTGEAVMEARDVAAAARQAIVAAQQRLRAGDTLLIFPEGTRSRSGGMQRFLAGATRYLNDTDAVVVPIAITGTEKLFPIGERWWNPVRLVATVGRPVETSVLRTHAQGNRRVMMDCVGLAIAQLLPEQYRGVYTLDNPDLGSAPAVLNRCQETGQG